ncbi:MAG: TrbI/VirB10 family protein [Candidatus Woesearchaeota archaeon]|jgi:type IV secretory pathway VirB10-like protein|nr:TrbI/VirB10 family protein [Candidatus Woesearchaeota archaeon]
MINNILQHKTLLIATGATIAVITTTAIAVKSGNNSKQEAKEQKKIEYVFDEEFFGKTGKTIEIKENPFLAEKIEEPEAKPQIQYVHVPVREQRERGTFQNKSFISYNDNDNDGSSFLLDNKDNNPSTIVGKSYDLSRVITTNKYIPLVLDSAINTEIPSNTVTAIVESNVYGYHAKDVLIPRYSIVEGRFEAVMTKASKRIQLAWYKITTPDGKIIELEDSVSMDYTGASGVTGHVDTRAMEKYGGALAFGGINALANLSVDLDSTRQQAFVQSITQQVLPITTEMIRQKINIKPIITIRQGERFNIKPHKNLYFKEANGQSIKTIFVD